MAANGNHGVKFVAYYRVSTEKQGRSGLGLDAQREAVTRYVASVGGELIAPPFTEIESGKVKDRPELMSAMARCKVTRATLIVAKLDRLSRDAAFLMTLHNEGVKFVACDLPEANTMTVGVMASVAQYERERISQRTRDALKAAKARGRVLGGRRPGSADIGRYLAAAIEGQKRAALARLSDLSDMLHALEAQGLSLQAIARQLNADHVQSPRGGQWTATAVRRALARLSTTKPCAIAAAPMRSRMVEAVAL